MTKKDTDKTMAPPEHVAIIMDGNGRWAEKKGMDRFQGHQQGAETARSIIKKSGNLGIKWLTLYAFSIENWARPEKEKSSLFSLMVKSLSEELPLLLREGIRFRMIGDKRNLPDNLIKIIVILYTLILSTYQEQILIIIWT